MDFLQLTSTLNIQGTLHGNELRARCPLHSDRNPSFSVNINSGYWKCHAGCGHGSFINLIERCLGCSIQEAWEWLRSNGSSSSLDNMLTNLGENLFATDLTEREQSLVWKRYYDSLDEYHIPMWFLGRGFNWETIIHWGIRYDKIWDSVSIPVKWQGNMVGIVTRNSHPDLPKYQNSKDLPKSEILWGEISTSHNDIILCEGALDNLWLWQWGYNSVGLLGSDISKKQLELLKKHSYGEIILALDNDEAGIKGTQSAVSSLISNGWILPQITQIKFPTGVKDPQDCSPELLLELYNSRQPVINFS